MSQDQQQSSTATAPSASTPELKWYQRIPDPMVLIFLILVAAYLMTFIVPAGEFERETVGGRTTVIPDSFRYLADVANLHPFSIFVAIPEGLIEASQYLFIVFIAGGLFHILQRTGALENAIGVAVDLIRNRLNERIREECAHLAEAPTLSESSSSSSPPSAASG